MKKLLNNENRVLFIFDDEYRKFYVDIFSQFGLQVDGMSYIEAIDSLNSVEQYDLIITDISFNRNINNGFFLLEKLRKVSGLKIKNNFLIVFSNAADIYEKRCIDLGVDQVVLIPSDLKKIELLVKQWDTKIADRNDA